VRVLHREAGGDEFFPALDGYITHWDGLDDAGNPCPPGHYSGRGYMVGQVTVEKVDKLPVTASGYRLYALERDSRYRIETRTSLNRGFICKPTMARRSTRSRISAPASWRIRWIATAPA